MKEKVKRKKREVSRVLIDIKNKNDKSVGCDRGNRNIKHIVAKSFFLLRSFILNQRLIVRTKNFGKQGHAQLREQHADKPKREYQRLKWHTKIGRDAGAKSISQRGEEEVEGTGEF